MVPSQRNRKSIKTNKTISKIMKTANRPPAGIDTNEKWHAWFDRRRSALQTKIRQAESAEWNWPSTRRRVELYHLENELKELDEQEFVVPNFGSDYNTAPAVWPPVAAG